MACIIPMRRRALLTVVLLAARAGAEEPKSLLPCRPTIACTAELAPEGTLQLELGYLRRALAGGVTQESIPFLAKLALADWLEAQVSSNGYTVSDGPAPARFHDNLQLGFKASRKGGTAFPTVGASLQLAVPTPGRQLGYLKATDALVTGYLTYMLPANVEADMNLGANVFHIEGSAQTQPWAALALSRDLPLGLTAMAEGYRFGGALPYAQRDAGLLAALSWTATSWLVIDAGGDAGLFPRSRRFSIFCGLSLASRKLWGG